MKTIHFIPPVIALAIVATWHTYLRISTANVTKENILLEEKFAKSRGSSDSRNDLAITNNQKNRSQDESNPSADWIQTCRDWKKLALVAKGDFSSESQDAWAQLEKLFSEMSAEELEKNYAEIASLTDRDRLGNAMLLALEQKNPEFAFSQYIAKSEMQGNEHYALKNFGQWLKRDPAAATAWYEKEIAKGTFDKTLDGNSRLRLPFEGGFISSLLASDPDAAERRLNDIPPSQRSKLFLSYMDDAVEKDQKAFADFVRKTIPKEEQMGLIMFQTVDMNHLDDTKKVLETFARIDATPEERSFLLQHEALTDISLKNFDRERMEEYRKWAQEIDPSSADRSAGLAFAKHAERYREPEDYQYLTKLALDYHNSGAGDDFLIALVEGNGSKKTSLPIDNARELAMKISDQNRRDELLEKLK